MFAKRNQTIGIFNTIPQGWTEISEAEYITLRNTPSVEVQREFKLKELKDCVNRLKVNNSEMYITSSLGFNPISFSTSVIISKTAILAPPCLGPFKEHIDAATIE